MLAAPGAWFLFGWVILGAVYDRFIVDQSILDRIAYYQVGIGFALLIALDAIRERL